jgi:hypothetical protein
MDPDAGGHHGRQAQPTAGSSIRPACGVSCRPTRATQVHGGGQDGRHRRERHQRPRNGEDQQPADGAREPRQRHCRRPGGRRRQPHRRCGARGQCHARPPADASLHGGEEAPRDQPGCDRQAPLHDGNAQPAFAPHQQEVVVAVPRWGHLAICAVSTSHHPGGRPFQPGNHRLAPHAERRWTSAARCR